MSSAEFDLGCVGNCCHLTPLMISKDDYYCADKHFLNVFLMKLTFFSKVFY